MPLLDLKRRRKPPVRVALTFTAHRPAPDPCAHMQGVLVAGNVTRIEIADRLLDQLRDRRYTDLQQAWEDPPAAPDRS